MKYNFLALTAAVFLSFCLPHTLSATPKIGSTSDIKFDYRTTGSAAWSNIYVFAVIQPQLDYSVSALEVLSSLKKTYADKNVAFFGLLPLDADALKKFAAAHPQSDITVCSDVDFKFIRKLLGGKNSSYFQCSIFNHAGKLLWSGEVTDTDMMLKRITGGSYSEREEIAFSALNSNLQAALRSGNAKLIGEAADRILHKRPEQISAVNAKAYALELAGDIDGLEKFYRTRIEKYPDEQGSYFTLLETALRIPQLNKTAPETALKYMQRFPTQYNNINTVVWSLLNRLPYSLDALKAALEGEKLLLTLPEKSLTSQMLMTRALIASRQFRAEDTIKLARAALGKAESREEKEFINSFLACQLFGIGK